MEIKKIIEINELLDIYSELLTDKQKLVMSMYYEEDLSLGEISEELSVSRQAVYDTVKKSEQILYSYENLLNVRENNIKKDLFKKELIDYLLLFESRYKENFTHNQAVDIRKIIEFCEESLT